MKLANLLSGIASISPVTLRMPNPALDVLGICEDDETAAKNRYLLIRLYTAEEFASASFSSNDTGCVMVCGCTAEKLKSHCDLIPPTLSLIGFSQSIGKQDILTAVECQFVKEQRLAAGTKMLFDAFLEDHCAQHIFDTAYRILKNPLFSCNIGNHYLAAVYDEEAFPADGPFARFILDDVLYRHVSDDGKLFIRHNKIDEALRTQSPLLFENTQLECQCLYGSLRMHNIPIGRVMMCAVEHPFSDFDIEMFERLCQFINHIIRMDYSFSYNGMNPEAVCLRDLLSSSYADEIMLKRSSASFNFPPNSHYQIAIVSLERPNADVDAINTLIYDLRGQFPNYPISALDGQTVILFPVDILGIDEKIREKMLDFSAAVGAMISLSNVFDTLREARAEYIKVSRTVTLGKTYLPQNRIVEYKEIILYELLDSYQATHRLVDLIAPEIQHILDTDQKNGGEYLNTVSAYLRCFGKSQKICEELHIHKNTLLYRLERLKDTFGLQLDDGDALIRYYLSLSILKVLDPKHDLLPEHIHL